ncbi:hypothetical protein PoB_006187900 [Plakobranchus ocellatus]|uniref:Uncharacterized protein n=1 Tax=Plakobranchus ocellatus TaxID=259542 RepID=A0AAV4CU05_9GAST|nr:hypothetical protein PoB_006187900 [Plakobranchus ocellatus]
MGERERPKSIDTVEIIIEELVKRRQKSTDTVEIIIEELVKRRQKSNDTVEIIMEELVKRRQKSTDTVEIVVRTTSPQQDDLRLPGPPSGQGANGEARTRDRKVPADLRVDSLATVPPTSPSFNQRSDSRIYAYI